MFFTVVVYSCYICSVIIMSLFCSVIVDYQCGVSLVQCTVEYSISNWASEINKELKFTCKRVCVRKRKRQEMCHS